MKMKILVSSRPAINRNLDFRSWQRVPNIKPVPVDSLSKDNRTMISNNIMYTNNPSTSLTIRNLCVLLAYYLITPSIVTAAANICFTTKDELKAAIDLYYEDDCTNNSNCTNAFQQSFGYPMNEWCVGNVTDMSNLFDGLGEFDEDISKWDTGRVTTMEKVRFFLYTNSRILFVMLLLQLLSRYIVPRLVRYVHLQKNENPQFIFFLFNIPHNISDVLVCLFLQLGHFQMGYILRHEYGIYVW